MARPGRGGSGRKRERNAEDEPREGWFSGGGGGTASDIL